MRIAKAIIAGSLAAGFVATSASTADASWRGHRGYGHGYYRGGPGPVLGLVGGVIVGAVTLATVPFAILAGATGNGPSPRDYDGPSRGYDGPPPRGYDGPPPGYYPPPPPPPRYYRQDPRYYGPPPDYYGR